jgi:putative transposase
LAICGAVGWLSSNASQIASALNHVPASSISEVAVDLSATFKISRSKTAEALAEGFASLHGKSYPKSVSVFETGIREALTYLSYPGSRYA